MKKVKKRYILLLIVLLFFIGLDRSGMCNIISLSDKQLKEKVYYLYGEGLGYESYADFLEKGIKVQRKDGYYIAFFTILNPKNDSKGRVERIQFRHGFCGRASGLLTMTEPSWVRFNENGILVDSMGREIYND